MAMQSYWGVDGLRSTRCCDETGMRREFASFLDKNAKMSNGDMGRRAKRPFDMASKFVMAVNGFSAKGEWQIFSNGRNAGATLIHAQE